MKKLTILYIAFYVFVFSACQEKIITSPFAHIKDEKVKDVLEEAIAASGGWENYKNMDSIFYKKRTVLYDKEKNMESDVTQFHKYQLKPALVMSISWSKDSLPHEIIFEKNKAIKKVNGNIVEADGAALKRTCMAAYYVLFMPFKLLDKGVALSYKGITKLPNGKEVHIIAADYDPDNNSNHSTNDDWEYYFDKNDYSFVANMVDHGDYFALIYNDKYVELGGLRFNGYRPSYRVDQDRNHLWKRGEFYYSDFVVK